MHPIAERIQREFAEGFVKAVEWRGDLAVTVTRKALQMLSRAPYGSSRGKAPLLLTSCQECSR